MLVILVSVMIFLTVSLISYLVMVRLEEKSLIQKRLLQFSLASGFQEVNLDEPSSPAKQILEKTGKLLNVGNRVQLELELDKAGIGLSSSEFTALTVLCALLPLFFLLVGGSPINTLALSLVGITLPQVYVKICQKKRTAKFSQQIPEALVMISNSLKAGYSFMQAIELVAEEMSSPISTEFARTLKEMNLGKPTEQSLQAMVDRVASDDFDLVITAVLIQRQVGGNLAEILDSIANTIRERVRIKGEIQTLTAQGRISGMVISLLPVGIGAFIFMFNPEYIAALFVEPLGRLLLLAGLIGQVIAAVLIKRIIDIKV